MRIREQRREDSTQAMARVYVKSWQSAYRGLLPDGFLDGLREERWSDRLAVGGPFRSFVAEEKGEIVGVCATCASRSEQMAGWGEVVALYLLPEWQGKGLGRALLEKALASLKAEGYAGVYLWMLEGNVKAGGFYEHCGFYADGCVIDDVIGGRAVREHRFVVAKSAWLRFP